jgi:hypothetical protein
MKTYVTITEDGTYNLFKTLAPGYIQLDIHGTFDSGTVTFKKCSTPDGTYTNYISEGATVAYTEAANPIFFAGGLYFQAVVSGSGTPSILIDAIGVNVEDHPLAGPVS